MRNRGLAGLMLIVCLCVAASLRAQEITPEPEITAAPTTPPATMTGTDWLSVLLNTRADLETLADNLLVGARPDGWNGSVDFNDPQLPLLVRLDLELLASTTLGFDDRPSAWFGTVASTPFAIARDIRHDLELLADLTVGQSIRPPGWVGGDPVMRCSRATQNLLIIAERNGFVLNVDFSSPDYCAQVELQVSQFTEDTIVADILNTGTGSVPPTDDEPEGIVVTADDDLRFSLVAFYDRGGSERAGIIPRELRLTVLGRSTATNSNMIGVRGDGFEGFVDYSYTTLTDADFQTLPDLDSIIINPFCNANWCD